ncbi:NUDIX hydrolase [Microbacterium sp. LRZ72]|uniref:NUDIX hydrolase n=1 Tax=Microbacterium sp. LRZ72 TaxID=2942481 RepID=UPI0029B9F42E|nr:NUDIX hydrolase [Microbacterium sp. LRZ72]MDX2375679.1 NUDIX hydrolase [Microbacterium sp. LRZ72]
MTDPTAPLADEPLELTVTRSDVAFDGRVWDVRRDTFGYNGEATTREYVAHTGAAAVVALDDDGRVLVMQQYRHPIRMRDWEIPAGLLDVEGEAPLETARRELAEEADLVATRWEPLVSIRTSPGGSDETVHVFLARELSAAPDVHAREAEEADIRLEWIPLETAVEAVADGRFTNAILAVGVFAAVHRLGGERTAAEG